MALRSFKYDDANYRLVRQHDTGVSDVASATAFAKFRSRVKVIVNAITVVVTSAASAAAVTFTALRAGSANTTFAIASATSVGAMTTASVAITLLSAGDDLALSHNDTGDYHVIYEYNVIAGQSLYSNQ